MLQIIKCLREINLEKSGGVLYLFQILPAMKKLILLLASLFALVSCENKTETLAICYRDIHSFAYASSDCCVNIINEWVDHTDYTWDGRELFNASFFDVLDEINIRTDWESIDDNMKTVDTRLNKRYPSEYESARNDLFRLYNIARKIRSHAKKVDRTYVNVNDVRDYREEYYELCEKYRDAQEIFESSHPEIVGQLHSLDELY